MKATLLYLCFVAASGLAQDVKVTPLLSKELKSLPGKEATMITVQYAPGASDPIHRHNANVFVYVLEGSVVMQVRGGERQILGPGQTFYEGPDDVHLVGRNASTTKPAKFLVFSLRTKAPLWLFPRSEARPSCSESMRR